MEIQLENKKSGGPIGLALTDDIADCYLIQWDKNFIRKMKTLGIDLRPYKKLKDDIIIIAEDMEKGSKFEGESIVLDMAKKETDYSCKDEDITMEIVVDVAESVDGMRFNELS